MRVQPNNRFTPGLQLLILFAILIITLIAGYYVSNLIVTSLYGAETFNKAIALNSTYPNALRALWVIQVVSTTLPILLTPILFSYLVVREPKAYLRTNSYFPYVVLALTFLIMLTSAPIVEVLGNLNQQLKLPPSLKPIEDIIRQSEDMAQKATENMLQMKNLYDLFFDLLMVGLITAIAEEFLFRGCLQTIFWRWTANIHVSIWITAFLFSTFHFEFYGFLPRLMLGVLFGYFAFWAGSIWPAVWGHFINNGTAVVVTYLYQHKAISIKPDDQHVFNYSGYIISVLITVLLLFNYRNIALTRKEEMRNY